MVFIVCSVIVSLTLMAEFGFSKNRLSDYDRLSTWAKLFIYVTVGWFLGVLMLCVRDKLVVYHEYKKLKKARDDQDKELYGC